MITCKYATYKWSSEDSSNVFQSTLPFTELKVKITEEDNNFIIEESDTRVSWRSIHDKDKKWTYELSLYNSGVPIYTGHEEYSFESFLLLNVMNGIGR